MYSRAIDFPQSRWFRMALIAGRITIMLSIALLVAGTILRYSNDPSTSISRSGAEMAESGSILVGVVLVGSLGLQVACWSTRTILSKTTSTVRYYGRYLQLKADDQCRY